MAVEYTPITDSIVNEIAPTSYNLGDAEQNWQAHTRLLDVSESGGQISVDNDIASGVGAMVDYTGNGHPFEFQPMCFESDGITGSVIITASYKFNGTDYKVITGWTQTITSADNDKGKIFGAKQWFKNDFKIEADTDDATATVIEFLAEIVTRGG